jgi:hypothetical protein
VLELVDGSHGCIPASWTDAFGARPNDALSVPAFSAEGLRELSRQIEFLEAR